MKMMYGVYALFELEARSAPRRVSWCLPLRALTSPFETPS